MKTDFLHSPFYYGFRTAREKYGFRAGYGMQTKVEFFWEQANTARATPSDLQRIKRFKKLFLKFKLRRFYMEKAEEDVNYL